MPASLKVALFSLLLLVSVCSGHISSEVYQIKSSSDDSCPREPCLTLSQFIDKSDSYIVDNTTLILQPGNHSLESVLSVSNISMLYLHGTSNTVIMCHGSGRFELSNTPFICISTLTFIGCPGNSVDSVHQFTLEDSSFIGQDNAPDTALELVNSTTNLYGNTFISNSGKQHRIKPPFTYSRQILAVGGAILSRSSNINIVGSWFEGNYAETGGAIFSELQSNVSISNSTFIGNLANPSLRDRNGYIFGGGAVYIWDGSITVANSSFYNNSAPLAGGAVYINSGSNTVANSSFDHNSGSAVYMNGGSTAVANASFDHNSAFNGGAMSIDGGSITVANSSFDHNSATRCGGAVFIHDGSITVVNSSFYRNSATYGGAVWMDEAGSTTVINSSFDHNSATEEGGAVYVGASYNIMVGGMFIYYCYITVANSSFYNNSAIQGGAMFMDHSNVTVANSSFDHNSATNAGGGVVYMDGVYITVAYSSFDHNSAGGEGGVFYMDQNSTARIDGTTFRGNTANKNGGVVQMYQATIEITNGQCHNNSVMHDGGVISASESTIEITNGQCHNNSVMHNGGVISASESTSKISGCFESNYAANDGGVIFASQGNLTISEQSTFSYNTAHSDGGVISAYQQVLHVSDGSIFSYNTAHSDGGVISTSESTSKISGCFESNYAANDGGVIFASQGNLIISEQSTFSYNTAHSDGGVISAYQQVLHVSDGSIFSYNTAHSDGGVISTSESTSKISGCFESNYAANDGGVIFVSQGNLTISEQSTFSYNTAHSDGGVISAYQQVIHVSDGSIFTYNTAHSDGGVISASESTSEISGCFESNYAAYDGGVISASQGVLMILEGSTFSNNTAHSDGGVINAHEANITIRNTSSLGNRATQGGAFYTNQGNVYVSHSSFSQNSVDNEGGAWFMENCQADLQDVNFTSNSAKDGGAVYSIKSDLTLFGSIFANNSAKVTGGAIYTSHSTINSLKTLQVTSNQANLGVIYLLGSTSHFHGHTLFSENVGSFMMFNSKTTFTGTTHFVGCSEPMRSHDTEVDMREGGAITASNSDIIFNGTISLTDNYAENGGAIHATDRSNVYVNGEMTIAYNMGNDTGGGVYLDTSEIHCQSNSSLNISSNTATEKGGGVHAISSSISVIGSFTYYNTSPDNDHLKKYDGSRLYFSDNEAEKGGGLCLETYSKMYIRKSTPHNEPLSIVTFSGNSADFGGAVYVSDDSDTCNPSFTSHYKARECVMQVLAIYSSASLDVNQMKRDVNTQNIYFSQNHANKSGSSLFGGLLDRCKLHHFSELQDFTNHTTVPRGESRNLKIVNGISYLTIISNINMSDISSEPVQLCFCKPSGVDTDCDYQPDPVRVIKGKRFSIKVAAVDEVGHLVSTRIHSRLRSTGGGFGSGQEIQNTSKTCTELNFNLFSPNDKEELIMVAEGPCDNSPQSQKQLTIHFTACDSCPIGFEKHTDEDTSCQCVCDSQLEPYITKCNASTELLEREGDFWITYVNGSYNATSGYLLYAHCPLNYCKPPSTKVEINLNIPGGADVQCADGHSGTLCGSCQSNLSLSLGSSRCIPCSTNWTKIATILVAAFFAGICLVALLLMLNLTVAVGTLNGIILYANIVASSDSTLLPFSTPNFATVFISWLNLEIGFDACLFDGMDAFWKTLLQLAFPVYVIFLVVMVIIISECWTKFARLVAKRNPVATLATLILLSYTKFLNTIITSLSHAILVYPDGSHRRVWLPDATVDYLKGKHIVLFAIALLILLASVVYTGLLFSWQWLLLCQDKCFILKWLTKNQKLCHFFEPYHAPYTFEQRYWTGLLLFVRVILYVISAVNLTGDPQVSLISIVIVVSLLPVLKSILAKMTYKEKPVDVMETMMYVNIVSFAAVTLKTGTTKEQTIVAYTSVLITIICLLIVILFHLYRYSGLLSAMKKIKVFIIWINNYRKNRHFCGARLPDEEDDHPLITHTVVELPHPRHLHHESQLRDPAVLVLDSPALEGDGDSQPFSPRLVLDNADITTGAAQQSHEDNIN